MSPQTFANTQGAADAALQKRALEIFAWVEASIPENSPTAGSSGAVVAQPSRPSTAASTPSLGDKCGGEYPPCYVAQRESGNTYGINTGNGYFGRWQFALDWGGKLGLPADITQATPEQEDEAARQLWAQGAGCSNWAAC